MNLWLSSQFLVAGLFLSSWALTPEECRPLVTPLSLDDPSMNYGRWNFIAGYSDNEGFIAYLKTIESSWMTVTASPIGSLVKSLIKINGVCLSSDANVTYDGNVASMSVGDLSSMFHLLPSCDDCLLMHSNGTARNFDKLLHKFNINTNVTGEEFHFHAVYLMARETMKDSDLEHFKQQVSCLGFSREPDSLYDPKNGFCTESESIKFKS